MRTRLSPLVAALVLLVLGMTGGSAAAAVPAAAATCAGAAEVTVWTGTDWVRIASALAANRSPCEEVWVSLPPLAADKKALRVLQDDVLRGIGVHPVAEFTLGDLTGWANWVKSGHTWFEAGVEFRRRMAAAGYAGPDEPWLLNEFDSTTMRDSTARQVPPEPDLPVYGRKAMLDLLQGLYYGDVGMEPLPGIVDYGIHFRHQNIPDVARYKEELKGWLADSAFWTAAAPMIRRLTVEVYADVRLWGVEGSTRNQRRHRLEQYQQHVLDLVLSGPPEAAAARALFERSYVPFFNGGYRARGGDQFAFVTGHGNTIVDPVTMQHFVTEQVHAISRYAAAHRSRAPGNRIGFSWQPCNRTAAEQTGCGAFDAAFQLELDAITARMAAAIRDAYGNSPGSACEPPAGGNWCEGGGRVPGAAFTNAWHGFKNWD